MSFKEKWKISLDWTIDNLWVLLVPIVFNLANVFMYQFIYKVNYSPVGKGVLLKIGTLSAPPNMSFLVENFPNVLRNLVFMDLNNVLLFITTIMIISFFEANYLNILSMDEPAFKYIFRISNRLWIRVIIFNLLVSIPMLLSFINHYLYLISIGGIILVYTKYALVVEDEGFIRTLKKSIGFLFDNLPETFGLVIQGGLILSLARLVIWPSVQFGIGGILFATVLFSFIGVILNKIQMTIYIRLHRDDNDNDKNKIDLLV